MNIGSYWSLYIFINVCNENYAKHSQSAQNAMGAAKPFDSPGFRNFEKPYSLGVLMIRV